MKTKNIILTTLLASALLANCAMDANAADIELTLGGWSAHFGKPPVERVNFINDDNTAENKVIQPAYNENNKALGIRYNNYEYTTFVNSYFNRSHMFTYHPRYSLSDDLKLGLRLGVATGYNNNLKGVVQPTATYYYKMVGVELGWLPSLTNSHPYGIFTLSGKVRF